MDQSTLVSEPPGPQTVPTLVPQFGDLGNFWKRYDELADQMDREMSKNLNTNLDVLLIFVSELIRLLQRQVAHIEAFLNAPLRVRVESPQAALFSAVNSTFIGVTMPSLSPDPLEKTNALLEVIALHADAATLMSASLSAPFSPRPVSVAVNCLVYSSLCFSLFAAVGAMQAKEWLQSYDRTGQAGSSEHQARVRQRKFNGAQQWHLETAILILPYLLLLSVFLFFAGVSLFLFPVNGTLAWVVIAVTGSGVSLSSLTIILGSMSPLCPYQTAASRGLRRGGKLIMQFWKQWLINLGELRQMSVRASRSAIEACRRRWGEAFPPRALPTPSSPHNLRLLSGARAYSENIEIIWSNLVEEFHVAFGHWTDALPRYSNVTEMDPSKPRKDTLHDEHVLNADVARCFSQMTADTQDQLILARNICILNNAGRDRLCTHANVWRRLSSLMLEAIHIWRDHPTVEKRTIVEQFGATLGHVLLQYPEDHDTWSQLRDMFPTDLFTSHDDQSHLTHLHYVVTNTFSSHQASKDVDHSLKSIFLRAIIMRGSLIQWNDLNCLTSSSCDDRILGMSVYIIRSQYQGLASPPSLYQTKNLSELWDVRGLHSRTDEHLIRDLVGAISSGVNAVRSGTVSSAGSQVEFLELYTTLVLRLKDFVSENKVDEAYKLTLWGSLNLMLKETNNVDVTWDNFPSQFSVEVFRLLQALYPDPGEVEWDDELCDGLWIAFSSIIEYERSRGMSTMTEKTLLEYFKWYFQCLGIVGQVLPPVEDDSNILKYIRRSSDTPSTAAQELTRGESLWGLIDGVFHEWEEGSDWSEIWLDHGPWSSVLTWFKKSETWTALNGSAKIIERIASGSARRAERLVGGGFAEAVAEVIEHAKNVAESFDGERESVQLCVLEMVLWMWNEGEGLEQSKWVTDRFLSAINLPMMRLSREVELQAAQSSTGYPEEHIVISSPNWYLEENWIKYEELSAFLEDIKKRLPDSQLMPLESDLMLGQLNVHIDSIVKLSLDAQFPLLRLHSWCNHEDVL